MDVNAKDRSLDENVKEITLDDKTENMLLDDDSEEVSLDNNVKDIKVNNCKKKLHIEDYFQIMLIIYLIFILLLLTLGIVSFKVGNTLPNDSDVFLIAGKNPSTNSENEVQKWESSKKVDIFKTDYVNDENVVIVASATGDKIFAPGSTAKYKFSMLNNANSAIVYEIDVNFILRIGNQKEEMDNFPFKVRLYNDSGDYLIGSEDELEYINDAKLIKHLNVLGKTSYEEFTLEVKWAYEGESDELDTQLGNYSSKDGVTLTFEINSSAEESVISSLEGGTKIDVEKEHTSKIILILLWIILLIINILILAYFGYIWFLYKKKKNNNE